MSCCTGSGAGIRQGRRWCRHSRTHSHTANYITVRDLREKGTLRCGGVKTPGPTTEGTTFAQSFSGYRFACFQCNDTRRQCSENFFYQR